MSDTLSRAYETAQRFAAEHTAGNDKARSLKLLARAALVTLANERSSAEAANWARSLFEELRTL